MFTPRPPRRPLAELLMELETAVHSGDRDVIESADREMAHFHGPEPDGQGQATAA